MTEKTPTTDKANLVHLLRELAAFQHSDVSIAKDAADTIEELTMLIRRMAYASRHGHGEKTAEQAMTFLKQIGLDSHVCRGGGK